MISVLCTGVIIGRPTQRVSQGGNGYAHATLRVPFGDVGRINVNVVAFSEAAMLALLALPDDAQCSIAGEWTPKVFSERGPACRGGPRGASRPERLRRQGCGSLVRGGGGRMSVALAITRTVMPDGAVGHWYQARLTSNGAGFPPYTWRIVEGSLAPGLVLNPDGFVFGVPTVETLNGSFTAQLSDAGNGTGITTGVVWYRIIGPPLPDPSNPNLQWINPDFYEGT